MISYSVFPKYFCQTITSMSHECHALSNHRQRDRLFNSLLKLTTKKTSKYHINLPFLVGSTQKGPAVRYVFPSHHDDVIKWKLFPRYWSFVLGIHRSPVNSPHKRQWRGALMYSLICIRINGWVNNDEAGDLRRHRAHYDVTVMWCRDI